MAVKPTRPEASLLLTSTTGEVHEIPIFDSLIIGRECRGIDPSRCYVIDEEQVSRTHVELLLDSIQDQAWVIDRSTNGTRLNGRRIERAVPVLIRPGDSLTIGAAQFQFQAHGFEARSSIDSFQTVRNVQLTELVMVVGDIISFSTISEYTADGVMMENIDRLYAGLRSLLGKSGGTLSNYVGDAFFATWEIGSIPDAVTTAVNYALSASEYVNMIAPSLALRDALGDPIRMGWSVAVGPAAISTITGMLVSVQTKDSFLYAEPVGVQVKGRTSVVTVYSTNRAATSTE
jgi:adenylate cyclase